MRIYLDDERNPKVLQFDHVVRSFNELFVLIAETREKISYISFDHDLGIGLTGYDAAKALCNMDMDHGVFSEDFTWDVHSANPVGSVNINAYLEGYFKWVTDSINNSTE